MNVTDMGERNVTNWMLYELIRDFKSDVSRRMDSFEKRMDGIERRINTLEDKVGEIYIHRNELTVKFTRSWALASLFMAMLASSSVLALSRLF